MSPCPDQCALHTHSTDKMVTGTASPNHPKCVVVYEGERQYCVFLIGVMDTFYLGLVYFTPKSKKFSRFPITSNLTTHV